MSWRPFKPPKSHIDTPLDQGAGLVTETSAAKAWIAAYRGTESVDWTDMLHWTGRRWAMPVRLPTAIQAAVTPAATQLWAFSDGTKPGGLVMSRISPARPGHPGRSPVRDGRCGASSTNIWGDGITATGRPGMEPWNVRTWQATHFLT